MGISGEHMSTGTNRLSGEKSPYLQQHANNPVDWYPWGDEAFERAMEENKPIFLSIGYSTCHWCHVMERESFENPEIASILNEGFVSIKVDREERPDVDTTYMDVCQMMTGSGGWPLTIIMRPDRKPFFAGTYIPPEDRYGMMGLPRLLKEIGEAWRDRRDQVDEVAERATSTMAARLSRGGDVCQLDETVMGKAFNEFEERYDADNGGFEQSPKFPLPHRLLFLLRYWHRTGKEEALKMVETTLSRMAKGGIHDHVGGGFHRYSTDPSWLVPHFEKMLYDQALLLMAYTEAYQITGRQEFRRTASRIIDYVLRDMTSPDGTFYSAEDADSEGEEGRFYTWTMKELEQVLGEDGSIIDILGARSEGNFLEESTKRLNGRNILHLGGGMEGPEGGEKGKVIAGDALDEALKTLRKLRDRRIRPLRDDKVLTDWNGLMIAALSKASWILGREDCLDAAKRAAGFLLTSAGSEGIRHRAREGEISREVFLSDHSFMIWGLLELYQASFEPAWLREAVDLSDAMIEGFWNENEGWFQLSPMNGEEMIFQKMEAYDGAIPSGNSAAFLDLIMLSRLTGRADLEGIAQKLSSSFSSRARETPMAHTLFLIGLDLAIGPSNEVVISGSRDSDKADDMITAIRERYRPRTTILVNEEGLKDIVPFAGEMIGEEGCMAYVCTERRCQRPTDSIGDMIESIDG